MLADSRAGLLPSVPAADPNQRRAGGLTPRGSYRSYSGPHAPGAVYWSANGASYGAFERGVLASLAAADSNQPLAGGLTPRGSYRSYSGPRAPGAVYWSANGASHNSLGLCHEVEDIDVEGR